MSLEFEALSDLSPIVVDIETCGLLNAAEFLEPLSPAKNLKDPEKVAADISSRTADRDAKLALDWNVGRIVALGWWTEADDIVTRMCATEDEEAEALRTFWATARQRTIVGFNVTGFDLRFMIQRSRYLRVAHPQLELGKYSHRGITDLYLDLTFNDGLHDQGAMRRTLTMFARRFGIPHEDTVTGADVPALVAAGDLAAVEAHLRADVAVTVALARRLGVLQPARERVGW